MAPSPSPAVQDGGTSRAPGTKTPRKVQWLDDRHRPDKMSDSTHALDEHGLDPNAFETLTVALERHRSSTPILVHHSPPLLTNSDQPAHIPTQSHHSHSTISTAINTSTLPSPTSPPSPANDVPGNFIDPNERAGLPRTQDLHAYTNHEASKLVRAHTRNQWAHAFPWSGAGKKPKKDKYKHRVFSRDYGTNETERLTAAYEARDTTDVERDGETNSNSLLPRMPRGGVLSALLSLYDHQHTASGASTPARTSGASTPSRMSGASTPARSSLDDLRRTHDHAHVHIHTQDDPLERTHPSASQSQSSLPLLRLARPPPTRNAAGVFGPLIAATGNISGAAAPAPSRLQPSIARSGFHLSRYSVDDDVSARPRYRTGKSGEQPKSSTIFEDDQSMPGTGTTTPATLPSPPLQAVDFELAGHTRNNRWSAVLKDLPAVVGLGGRSGRDTPVLGSYTPTTEGGEWVDEKGTRDEDRRREKRRKRRKDEVYITRHVAEIMQRREFIMKLTRAMMMFGGPSHRLQAQIQATARVLDVEMSCMYLPDVVLLSFDDDATGTSHIRLIRQGSTLDLDKLGDAYLLYWKVIHDELSVSEAATELDELMRKKQVYSWWQLVLVGGMCSSSICTVSFSGSFLDALIVFPLGALLVGIQLLSVRNELYSNVFEITVATLFSFISAALASSRQFCYSAIASSSVVLILPGFIVLCGSLEIMSRNIVAGSVRLCYAVVYSLFLGFGLAMGAEAYEKVTGKIVVGPEDYACSLSHNAKGAWYQKTPNLLWAVLTVPMFSLFLSMRFHTSLRRKEMFLLITISCIGWVTNHFTGTKFVNQSDISAAVGAFAVGIVSNLYGRFFSGNAFVIMITGILFQVPSGLGNGGLLTFASQQTSGSSKSYLSGFQTALQLISVSIGLAVGLGISLVLVHPIQSRRRAGGVFSL